MTKYLFLQCNTKNNLIKFNITDSFIYYGEQYKGVPTGKLFIYSFLFILLKYKITYELIQ